MCLSSYVVVFIRISIVFIIVICNGVKSTPLSNGQLALSHNMLNATSDEKTGDKQLSIEKFNNALLIDLTQDQLQSRRKNIHKRKSKPKQNLSEEPKKFASPTNKQPDHQTHSTTPSIARHRGFYHFPTGKHRNKKKYVDFRPLDLQLRDNLSDGSTKSNEALFFANHHSKKKHSPKHLKHTKTTKKRPKTHPFIKHKNKHNSIHPVEEKDNGILLSTETRPSKEPELIYPTKVYTVDNEIYHPTEVILPNDSPVLVYPTKIIKHETISNKKHPRLTPPTGKHKHGHSHGEGIFYYPSDKHRSKTPKVVYPSKYTPEEIHTEKLKTKLPKLVYPTGKSPANIYLPTGTYPISKTPKLYYPSSKLTTVFLPIETISSKDWHKITSKSHHGIYLPTETYPKKKAKDKNNRPKRPKNQFHGVVGVNAHHESKVESYDDGELHPIDSKIHSEDESAVTAKRSTRCSTVVPLPKLDAKYVPNETQESVNVASGDPDFYSHKLNNYLPPKRGSSPTLYIDDA